MKSPAVLLILFRRPEQTRQVFEAIRQARPERLYLAADGPRAHRRGEPEACQATRAVVANVDWPCEVKTLFRDANVGIRRNVAEAITWFLNDVGEGIVLEDDCLPGPDFFRFTAENLEKYRDDERVMQICGSGFVASTDTADQSYYFSRYGHDWGWATWKRAWDRLDLPLVSLDAFLAEADRTGFWDSRKERRYWTYMFQRTKNLPIDTWDYQWIFSIWKEGGLSLYPNSNLVTNLGFGEHATNTVQRESAKGGRPLESLGKMNHPVFVLRDRIADESTFRTMYWGSFLGRWKDRIGKWSRMARAGRGQ